ncbi:MAG: alanine racemase [Pseudomonadota bacterium]
MTYSASAHIISSHSNVHKANQIHEEAIKTTYSSIHNTYNLREINLSSIIKNFNTLQSICGSSHVYPVLKANAYGLGAIPIGTALQKAGCTAFFLAYIDEALALREHLPNVTLYVLNGPYDGDWVSTCLTHNIIPVLNTYEAIDAWHTYAQALGTPLKTALHVDTGMHRLGLSSTDLKRLRAKRLPYIDWSLVMSHLACADDPHSSLNEEQRSTFDALRHHFPGAQFSLANSSGVFLGKNYHYDIVRPGGALYGHKPTGLESPIVPCVTIKAKILQIQTLNPGESIGYSRTFIAEKPMLIATLALGYADAMLRGLSGTDAYAIINNQKAPFVGRISMDLITVDATHITHIAVNDWAILMGGCDNAMTLDDIATKMQTDSRDVLVSLGDRFNTVYTK